MLSSNQFQNNPREYALDLVSSGLCSADDMLVKFVKYLSHADLQSLLDRNELSPRFGNDFCQDCMCSPCECDDTCEDCGFGACGCCDECGYYQCECCSFCGCYYCECEDDDG